LPEAADGIFSMPLLRWLRTVGDADVSTVRFLAHSLLISANSVSLLALRSARLGIFGLEETSTEVVLGCADWQSAL